MVMGARGRRPECARIFPPLRLAGGPLDRRSNGRTLPWRSALSSLCGPSSAALDWRAIRFSFCEFTPLLTMSEEFAVPINPEDLTLLADGPFSLEKRLDVEALDEGAALDLIQGPTPSLILLHRLSRPRRHQYEAQGRQCERAREAQELRPSLHALLVHPPSCPACPLCQSVPSLPSTMLLYCLSTPPHPFLASSWKALAALLSVSRKVSKLPEECKAELFELFRTVSITLAEEARSYLEEPAGPRTLCSVLVFLIAADDQDSNKQSLQMYRNCFKIVAYLTHLVIISEENSIKNGTTAVRLLFFLLSQIICARSP